ncbi:MAG: helix-turn-helix transcriptional regulator [Fibrella sp.]|nr:helix-turn-helix transcriptional regulator [Armatimonadota bacterium]
MNTDNPASSNRERELLGVLERQLSGTGDSGGDAMASDACLSRFHFQRVFRETVGESPGEVRRRLQLERAAHELRSTTRAITVIALEAEYRSLEGFGRAFKTMFRVSPREYRKLAARVAPLPLLAPSGVHYNSAVQGIISLRGTVPPRRKTTMNLTERLLDSDYRMKQSMLQMARLLSDAQLDAPLAFRHSLMPFVEPEKTLRETLDRMITDIWVLTLFDEIGWKSADGRYRTVIGKSVEEMITRLDGYHADFSAFVRRVAADDSWETEWVDRACEPAETFTYGAVIEGVLTWGIPQRIKAQQQLLGQLGLNMGLPLP